jgi:hypothetical protein
LPHTGRCHLHSSEAVREPWWREKELEELGELEQVE